MNRKPVIGLALGSGSARGWAHIGVIRALQQAGIQRGNLDLGAAQVDAQAQAGHAPLPPSSACICASSITGTPSSRALSSLLPASSPATT